MRENGRNPSFRPVWHAVFASQAPDASKELQRTARLTIEWSLRSDEWSLEGIRVTTLGKLPPTDFPREFGSALHELAVRFIRAARRCDCGVWFLPRHGRQHYHDAACAARSRWLRFAPKRKRDYKAEYERRRGRARARR